MTLALLVASLIPALAENHMSSGLHAVKLRLGVPGIVRGPGYDVGDGPMTFLKRADGTFLACNANQVTWCASTPDMIIGYSGAGGGAGAKSATVRGTGDTLKSSLTLAIDANQIAAVSPGVSTDACGDWITADWLVGPTWYALVHNEGPCNYKSGSQTNKSMAIYTTSDEGATWVPMAIAGITGGTAISTLEGGITDTLTGIGDCTWTPDATGTWLYTYCGVYPNYRMAIIRAPAANPAPGNFQVRYQGVFATAALNIPWNATTRLPAADLIDWIGTDVSSMPGIFNVLAAGQDHVFNGPSQETIQGITLAVSNDYVHFEIEPLLNYDAQNYPGPSSNDLYLYPVLRNATDGSTVLAADKAVLWYTWVPPNNSLNNRFVVQQSVTVTKQALSGVGAETPNVGIALETWYNAGRAQYRSTTVNPLADPGSDGRTQTGWTTNSLLGYILPQCPGSKTVNKCDAAGAAVANRIEECWNKANGDFALHIASNESAGSCLIGVHHRTVGWLYRSAPNGFATNPVFSCSLKSGAGYHFASSDPACNGQTVLGLLGFALAN